MSFEFYCKLNQAFGIMLLGIVFGVMGFAATVEIQDLDLWLHLQMGNYILAHGSVPGVDVLSASMQGMPWVNHEWLFQVVVYLVKSTWGFDGLLYMQVGVVLFTCAILLMLTYDKERQLLSAGLMILLFFMYQTRFTVRPDLFSFLFFAMFIYILSSRLNERWALPALVVIQILWTNMHGFFFMGIVFVVIGVVSEFIRRNVPFLPWEWSTEGKLDDDEYRRLRWALVLLILATFVNPLGIQGALYPFHILTSISGDSKIFFEHITELQRPFTQDNWDNMMEHWPLRIMVMVSFLSFVFNRRKIDISALLFWIFFLCFGMSALRNIVYFSIAAYLVTMINASNIKMTDLVPFKAVDDKFVQITGTITRILLIIYIMNYGNGLAMNGYYDFEKYERKSSFFGVDLRFFPHRAADFLRDNKIKGNFLNDFNSGAYLIGRVYPDIRVYMDGRTELRGPKFFENYRKIWDQGDEQVFEQEVKKYHLTGVFVNTVRSSAPESVLKMLSKKTEWKVVYLDYDAVIFLKDIPENAEYIRKHAIDLSKWQAIKVDLKRFGPAISEPYQNVDRSYSLLYMGYMDQAEAEADAALEVNPSFPAAYKIKARIYYERKDWERAFRTYRIVTAFASGDIQLRYRLAMSYLKLGDYDYALKEAEKIIERTGGDRGFFMKGKALLKKKDYRGAYDIVLHAVTLKPQSSDDLIEIGDLAFEDNAFAQARRYYALAIKQSRKNAQAYVKMAHSYEKQGRQDQAILEFKKSLAIAPDDQDVRKELLKLENGK